jgi:hypothetical protein
MSVLPLQLNKHRSLMLKLGIEISLRLTYMVGAITFLLSGVAGCWVKPSHTAAVEAQYSLMLIGAGLFLLSYLALAIWYPRPKIEGNE